MEWGCLLVLLLAAFYSESATAETFESDVRALQLIAKGWQASALNWTGYDPCGSKWRSVYCNENGTRVTKIISNTGSISGTLSPPIGDLTALTILDLSYNPGLAGNIPRELGKLRSLKSLSLQSCSFTGSIPAELGRLTNLTFLALNKNKLSGEIPPDLGRLSKVYWLDLAENQLTGSLPVSTTNGMLVGLDNMVGAKHFHLFNNSFSGSLPKELATLPILQHLLVDNNMLTGEIPLEYANFSNLTILRVDNNMLTGSIPRNLPKIKTLVEMHVRNNTLVGALPDFSNSSLSFLSLGLNVYDWQEIPSSISSLKLQTFEADHASLNGSVPTSLIENPALESLSLARNQLSGRVDLTNAPANLTVVNLESNKIIEVIPAKQKIGLSLAENPVCTDNQQQLPEEVCVPASLLSSRNGTNMSCSSDLQCKNDKQYVNPYYCTCAVPLIVYFQFNAPTFSNITGGRMDTFRFVIYNSTRLKPEQVYIKNAFFILNHRLILEVFIFPNKTEEFLDYDLLIFINRVIFLHELVGNPSEWGPYAVYHSIASIEEHRQKGWRLSTAALSGIVVGGFFLLAGLVLALFYAMFQKRRAGKAASKSFTSWFSFGSDAPQLKGARYFSLQEIKKATNNFSNGNEVGSGGYGKVYKAQLLTGEVVAIKRAQEGSMQGAVEFKTEIELLSRVHHRNLVGLIGFCCEQGAQVLVYEYMENGSLKDLLDSHSTILTWRKRVEIALDSAKGLAYLHELAEPPIIHRDVKSSNILLDQNFSAKVADFGLGKLGIDGSKTHISTQVKGTLGYLDPEYYMTQQLTDKSDVYGFGVVLLELLTARSPIQRGKYIVREVRQAVDRGGGVLGIAGMLDEYLVDYTEETLSRMVNLALACVRELSTERPTMGEAVKELEEILLALGIDVSTTGTWSSPLQSPPRPLGIYEDFLSRMHQGTTPSNSTGFQRTVEPK